jgi:hypothetical protein
VDPGDWREESRPALNANPGNCCEESPLPVPVSNPTTIASAQTVIAVIQTIRTATKPFNLASDMRFTIASVWSRCRVFAAGDCCPGAGHMAAPPGRSAP